MGGWQKIRRGMAKRKAAWVGKILYAGWLYEVGNLGGRKASEMGLRMKFFFSFSRLVFFNNYSNNDQ